MEHEQKIVKIACFVASIAIALAGLTMAHQVIHDSFAKQNATRYTCTTLASFNGLETQDVSVSNTNVGFAVGTGGVIPVIGSSSSTTKQNVIQYWVVGRIGDYCYLIQFSNYDAFLLSANSERFSIEEQKLYYSTEYYVKGKEVKLTRLSESEADAYIKAVQSKNTAFSTP